MKMTELVMESTDTGAVVRFTSNIPLDIRCPRCDAKVESGIEHRCGDMRIAKPSKFVSSEAKL